MRRTSGFRNELNSLPLRLLKRLAGKPDRPSAEETALPFAGVATRASIENAHQFLREQPERIALCHPDWRGVRTAAYGHSAHVLEVPGILSDAHCERLASFIEACKPHSLIIEGYPPRIDELVLSLSRRNKKLEIYCVYHGTPSLLHFQEDTVINRMLELVDAGSVRKLGFVKSGLAEWISTLGYPAQYLMNVCQVPFSRGPREVDLDGKLHLGVFAPNLCHKNVPTQVIAALMIPGSIVHTSEPLELAYLRHWGERVVTHGIIPRPNFLELLGRMHGTLYVSLVECYPMTVLESLAAGAVCLTSHTSTLFESDPVLQKALVVEQYDNPSAIADQLGTALENRETLVARAQEHILRLNETAERLLQEFLDS